MEMTGLI